jgi:23S rRNA (cytosine1962-C5)-methyltransferase
MKPLIPEWTQYALLDSGAGRKLERFGDFGLVRPEAQADWRPMLPAQQWDAAHAEFVKAGSGRHGEWKFRTQLPSRWIIRRNNLSFWVQPTPSGHVGVFPDQACHWDWVAEVASRAARPLKLLCLFGHTGLATLAAAAAGAEVTHVDASRKAVAWARENQMLSDLSSRPIRWIVDDAPAFVKREARRQNLYNAIILDPPAFGRGPRGEIWKTEELLPELLSACASVLSASPTFVLLNLYTTALTCKRTENEAKQLRLYLKRMLGSFRPAIHSGELAIADGAGRKISAAVFARAQF